MTIHLDAPAFSCQGAAAQWVNAEMSGLESGQLSIFTVPLLIAPAVKVEVHRRQFTRFVGNEIGSDIAHPNIIELGNDKGHIVATAFYLR